MCYTAPGVVGTSSSLHANMNKAELHTQTPLNTAAVFAGVGYRYRPQG